jgi:DNA polymerase-3 subunit epsilon
MIRRCLIIDTETNDLDATKGERIEIACILFSLESVTALTQFSTLLPASSGNPPETARINRISNQSVREFGSLLIEQDGYLENCTAIIGSLVAAADVIVAHNAEFDRRWWKGAIQEKPWACTLTDFDFPMALQPCQKLVDLALDHDVPVASAHRALTDCALLAAILSRYDTGNLQVMFARAMRPKGFYQAIVPFDQKDEAKSRGFAWCAPDAPPKSWTRWMAIEDAAALPFRVERLDA